MKWSHIRHSLMISMDADIAMESTKFARYNILVQASASMTAQANQLSNVALSLIG